MRRRIVVCVGIALLFAAHGPVRAHHSFAAEFDADKPFKVTGPVTKVEWTNPHSSWAGGLSLVAPHH